ncbi:MAG: leucine-rich repeat domain-containing protein [Lachnospiraceae bacterium]|nr:leucine-rich repeat domain-containing protein [Lachnospiraceae bacterium]
MKVEQRMKQMWVACLMLIIGVMSLTIPSKAATLTEGDYEYEILEDGTAKITRYIGADTEVTIPSTLGEKKVTVIGDKAFTNCDKITKATIPDGVTKIGETGDAHAVGGAFYQCSALIEIVIPGSVKSIAPCAFIRCVSLKTLILPEGLEKIDEWAFNGCSSLESVVIPTSVKAIENRAFADCNSLKTLTLPEGLETLGNASFAGCKGLSSVSIPKSVTWIGGSAPFGGCGLDEITVEEGNTRYYSEDNCLIDSYFNETLVQGCNNSKIPMKVTAIADCAFAGCEQLTNITIPSGVKKIGSEAFKDCVSLEKVVLPSGMSEIKRETFMGCSGLQDIVIPASVSSIGEFAFKDCTSLKNVTISEGVTSLNRSFDGCTGLQQVTIPSTVISMDEDEFYCFYPDEDEEGDCAGTSCPPKTLKIYTTPGSYAAEWVKKYASNNDASATQDSDPQPVTKPDQPATPNQTTTQTPSGATSAQAGQNTVKLPAAKGTVLTVTEWQCQVRVTSDAAADPTVEYLAITNKKTATIKVPDSVTVDGITYKVTAVADKALAGNKKVKKVVLGVNVASIGKNAFAKCKNLKKIEVKSSQWNKKSVGKNAFKGTSKKLVVKVPKKMTSAYEKYVKGKGNKTVRVK